MKPITNNQKSHIVGNEKHILLTKVIERINKQFTIVFDEVREYVKRNTKGGNFDTIEYVKEARKNLLILNRKEYNSLYDICERVFSDDLEDLLLNDDITYSLVMSCENIHNESKNISPKYKDETDNIISQFNKACIASVGSDYIPMSIISNTIVNVIAIRENVKTSTTFSEYAVNTYPYESYLFSTSFIDLVTSQSDIHGLKVEPTFLFTYEVIDDYFILTFDITDIYKSIKNFIRLEDAQYKAFIALANGLKKPNETVESFVGYTREEFDALSNTDKVSVYIDVLERSLKILSSIYKVY